MMSVKQETAQAPEMTMFDMSACIAMMEKLMGQHSEECDCEDMMSQFRGMPSLPEEWLKVMSQMMNFHCACQGESEQSLRMA